MRAVERVLIADVGAAALTVSRTLTSSLLGTSTFTVHYESTAAPNFWGVYPTETFQITFSDPFGAPVHHDYTFRAATHPTGGQ